MSSLEKLVPSAQIRSYLLFTLNGEPFATDVLAVREIIDYRPPMPEPRMQVLDLAYRLGRGWTVVGGRSSLIVLGRRAGEVGILVEDIHEIVEFSVADIEPAPGFDLGLPTGLVTGIGRARGRAVLILDLPRLAAAI